MSQKFEFVQTTLDGLYRVDRKPIIDSRGFFNRFFCADEFCNIGFNKPIAQINHSFTHQRGAVRGMHFQLQSHAETKIVTCIRGKILDVAVDVRQGSDTFLQWHTEVLSADNQRSLYIPEGFAHGFQTLDENCELIYLHSSFYKPDAEAALNVNDPRLSIKWPLNITEMSERDKNHPMLGDDFLGI